MLVKSLTRLGLIVEPISMSCLIKFTPAPQLSFAKTEIQKEGRSN
jgi:hypothetical protein